MTPFARFLRIFVPFLLGGVVGAVTCSFLVRPPSCPTGTTAILVGPTAADVSPECVKLSKRQRHQAYWTATSAAKRLFIEFEGEPFEGMSRQSNGRYRVSCVASNCSSGPIKQSAPTREFKYWQALADSDSPQSSDFVDGRIIIEY